MESNEKKYTLEDVKASTQEAEAARYRFVGCMYKTLKEELGEEQANDLMYKAYFKYGHTKHPEATVVPGNLSCRSDAGCQRTADESMQQGISEELYPYRYLCDRWIDDTDPRTEAADLFRQWTAT